MSLQSALEEAVRRVRLAGTDLDDIEVKSAGGGLPTRIAHTVCAMANGEGGLVILGLDERQGFAPVPIEPDRLAEQFLAACRDQVSPPVRPRVDIGEVDGSPVVVALVEPLPTELKPCFVAHLGVREGSFIRSHDGNRRLSAFEIHTLESRRGQPRDDAEPVPEAAGALDQAAVAALLTRVRSTRTQVFDRVDDETALKMLGVLVERDGRAVPTMAGLLALGAFPQQFAPQLDITFVAFPTTDGRPMADGTRFLDNQAIDGPIPVQLATALAVTRRNMSRRARIIGIGRADEWEYPQEALREVIVNALMHRDYGPLARGSQVRIEMYPDRLVVTSPGGLHGNVDEADLMSEPVTSSRNAHLAKLLEDVVEPGTRRTVCENRGSGLLALADALRRAGMTPPTIRADLKKFEVTLYNHTLLDDEALAWLQRIGAGGCSDTQKLGLAAARRDGTVTNANYRVVTGLDAFTASRELSSLAQAGFLERAGGRRFAVWRLVERPDVVGAAEASPALPVPEQERIREALSDGPRSATEIARRLGLSKQAVLATVREMRLSGLVAPTEEKLRSPKNKWQLMPRIPGDARPDPNAVTGP